MGNKNSINIVWIYPGELVDALDQATWLSTTKSLRDLGCKVTLLNIGQKNCTAIDGVKVQCIPASKIYFWGKLFFHLKIIPIILSQWKNLDIVLLHPYSVMFILPSRFFCVVFYHKRKRPLFVVDIRTVFMASEGEKNWKTYLRKIYFDLMLWAANQWADGQTAITDRLAQDVGIPKDKIWGVWPSGVDLDDFKTFQLIRRWVIDNDPLNLIYIGTMNDGRNLMAFGRAVKIARDKGMHFIMTYIGDGYERAALEKFAQEYPNSIHVHPPIPHKEIPNWLSKAHIGVLPFPNQVKFQVSSPIKLFEYMAAGIPILATRIVCHTDVVQNGNYVFWIEKPDETGFISALTQIWNCRNNLKEMGDSASEASKQWTWNESAKKLQAALELGLSRFCEV